MGLRPRAAGRWCSNLKSGDLRDPEEPVVQFKSEEEKTRCLALQQSGSRNSALLEEGRGCSFCFQVFVTGERPTHDKESDLLYTQTTMPVSSRNTLTEILKTMFDPISEHPMAQSS